MGLITSSGIGSGIDVEAIIGAILNAERAPKESSLSRNEKRVDSTLSALGKLSSALSTLNDALDNLNTLSSFRVRTAVSSDETFLTATATSEASSGSFSIVVDTIAKGSRLESTAGLYTDVTDTVGTGTLTLTAGTETFDVVVGATDTLEDIRDAINSSGDNFGVSVNIVNGTSGPVLSITSSVTGPSISNTLVITNNDASLDNISTGLSTAQSSNGATATIDGITVTSDTNTFTDSIQDLTFTALKVTEAGSPIILGVDIDKEAVKESITSFITAVNDFNSLSKNLGLSTLESVGALAGDVTLRLLNQKMVVTLQDAVSGLTSNFDSLNSLGITFDEFGSLNIDETALDSVIDTNFDDIANVFASTSGVSIKLQTMIGNYIGSGNVLDIRETSLNDQKRRLDSDRLNFEYRMTSLETQLRAKFGAMDALVAQMNNTGSFLSQQLANLPGFGSSKS
ncbi:MAG: flagellar hook-associated protein 2 [Enterobacterales bacterium]|jgi:flagellar hook-associated protein 2